MAITMWDHLIPGLQILQSSRYPQMDMTYFTFHRELESTHEDAMKKAVAVVDGAETGGLGKMTERERDDFRGGVTAGVGCPGGFWVGLGSRAGKQSARSLTAAPRAV